MRGGLDVLPLHSAAKKAAEDSQMVTKHLYAPGEKRLSPGVSCADDGIFHIILIYFIQQKSKINLKL